jgi:hypothetical protein
LWQAAILSIYPDIDPTPPKSTTQVSTHLLLTMQVTLERLELGGITGALHKPQHETSTAVQANHACSAH